MRIKVVIPVVTLVLAGSVAFAQSVSIGVLGLFRPQQLMLTAPGGSALTLHAGERSFVLEKSSGIDLAHIRRSGDAIILEVGSQIVQTSEVTVTGRDGSPVVFLLAVPRRISRRYRGTLQVRAVSETLVATVGIDLESAVASVVAAETTADVPLEALKAQAIAARSYLVAGKGRHHNFDFCDTTHCQFLREPPTPGIPAAKAALDTRGLVMVYESHPFAAMYTRSCGGRTRTPAELGLPTATYPYYSVDCKFCREHPPRWQSRIFAQDAPALHRSDESARLGVARRLGWNTVQSNDFTMKRDGERVILQGTGRGHGIGLCQSGAKAMAQDGASFRQILNHYYPNTTIVALGHEVASIH